MATTIYDIAEQAGVSTATVSRVFNGSARVAEATRRRVLDVAEGCGYQPHVSAQNLARQQTQLVSAVIPVMTNHFYMNVARGMQDALSESEFDLLVYAAPKPEEIGAQLGRALQRGRAEGLLLLSTQFTEEQRRRLKASQQAIVLVDAAHADFDSVSVNNERGGYLATRHLIAQGYRRIAHITVAPPEPPPALARRRGYEKALRKAGRPTEAALVVASRRRRFGFVEATGHEAMQKLLRQEPRPDAVFVASDIQALGALRAVEEAGLRVPEDVALVGFDDIEVSAYVGLTTLRQPMHAMGRLAIETLLRRVREPEAPPKNIVLEPRLVRRRTAGEEAPV